nr:MAG TPA: hypothetical protein [Caudoviricetes sp.]
MRYKIKASWSGSGGSKTFYHSCKSYAVTF